MTRYPLVSKQQLAAWWAMANGKEPPFDRPGLGWTEDMIHGAFVVLEAIVPVVDRKKAWATYLRRWRT